MKRIVETRKGQLFSGDIAVATVVFIAALSLAFFLWNSTSEDINRAENLRNLQKVANSVTEQLIRTPGVPENWIPDCDGIDAKAFGLATSDRIINETKAAYFVDVMNETNYDDCKYLLGLGEYDLYMEVTNLTGSMRMVNGTNFTAGPSWPPATYDESIAIIRTAIYQDELVRVKFIIWK